MTNEYAHTLQEQAVGEAEAEGEDDEEGSARAGPAAAAAGEGLDGETHHRHLDGLSHSMLVDALPQGGAWQQRLTEHERKVLRKKLQEYNQYDYDKSEFTALILK